MADSDQDPSGMANAFDSLLAQSRKQFDDLFAGPDTREAETAPQAAPAAVEPDSAGREQAVMLRGTADGIPFIIRLKGSKSGSGET